MLFFFPVCLVTGGEEIGDALPEETGDARTPAEKCRSVSRNTRGKSAQTGVDEGNTARFPQGGVWQGNASDTANEGLEASVS